MRTAHPVVAWLDEERFVCNRTRAAFGKIDTIDGLYLYRLGERRDRCVFAHPEGEGHASLPLVLPGGRLLCKTLDFVTQAAGLREIDPPAQPRASFSRSAHRST